MNPNRPSSSDTHLGELLREYLSPPAEQAQRLFSRIDSKHHLRSGAMTAIGLFTLSADLLGEIFGSRRQRSRLTTDTPNDGIDLRQR